MRTIAFHVFVFAALAIALPAMAQPVRIHCSETTAALGERIVTAYLKGHPDIRIEVKAYPTPDVFGSLAGKKADIAVAARSMRYKEAQACEAALGQRPIEYKAGVIGVAAYVNAANGVKELTYDDLAAIYRGKVTNWKDVGGQDSPIVVLGLNINTPPGELFVEEVLNGKEFSKEVRLVKQEELPGAVAKEANSIGFASFFPSVDGTRAVSIKRVFSSTPVDPSSEAISNRIYPITRFVFCYLSPQGNQESAKSFLEWVRGDEGQKLLTDAGFFPLGAKWRAPK